MICVILGRGRHSALLQEWKEAVEGGADLVELRVDCLRRDIDLKRLLTDRKTPVVFTIRRANDGGMWRQDEEKRLRILREAIVAGVDYVDLEMDIAQQVPRYGRTKRIVSYHNFKKTPKELPQIIEQMEEMNADIVKVAVMATTLDDALFVLDCARKATVPTIALAMGELGYFTRVLSTKYGAPFTYAGFNPDRVFAPGIPNYSVLRNDYFFSEVNEETQIYAVIGDPILQSFSPAVHNAVFRHYNQNKLYVPIRVKPEELKGIFERFAFLDIKGYSVTIPHKEAIIPLLDEIDDLVDMTGSCNTVEILPNGQRKGYNTDYSAAIEAMETALGGKLEGGLSPLDQKQAVVLGAGGTARSVAFALSRSNAGVSIASRDDSKANRLAGEVGCKSINWVMRASTICDILVNCTPVGMHPQVDDSPVPPAAFREGMLAFDAVYHPENTLFLKLARDHMCKVATGVDMFVQQAAAQSRIFTGGLEPPVDLIRHTVQRKFSPYVSPIF